MNGVADFLQSNFWHVAPILLMGIFGLAVILERARALMWAFPFSKEDAFFEKLRELVLQGQMAEAVSLCDRYPGKPVAWVAKRGLLRAHQPESLIENGLEIAVEEATQRVLKRTGYLSMISNVATLLGLLGTIAGLVKSFAAVGTADAAQKSALLAQGISEAMYATMFGLGVAIPCMIAFSFLMNRTNTLISGIESSAVKVMDLVKQRYFAAEMKAQGLDSGSASKSSSHHVA